YLNTVENGTTNSGNVHVGRDLLVSTGRTEDDINFGLKLNDSEVRVGRDLVIGSADGAWGGWHPVNRAAIKLMNSTIRIGRHLTINRPSDDIKAFGSGRVPWDAGTSTIIFDGNGLSGITQTVRAWGAETPLHNVVIDTLGTVQIDTYTWGGMPTGEAPSWVGQDNALRNCELYLTGNLSVLNGTFNQNDRLIIFNGPEHYLTVGGGATINGGTGFDNIELLADAVVILGSHVTMENLLLGLDAKLYLNGFTLGADDLTYVDGDQPWWDNDLGRIYSGSPGVVPEPATMLLIGSGALGLLGYLRRRRMT
ncbi:MAG TPA: PEP-CTERM sorting domain-containing protein, partial [Planctomycetota bacterium]|nr:PEP-CTERM sorting domain-containing protein [Planctomycetota bacterium]